MSLFACTGYIEKTREENLEKYSPVYSTQKYDRKRVRKINGVIESVGKITGTSVDFRGAPSIVLVIETPDKKLYGVDLGPELYITRQHPKFKQGDEITVIGDVDEWKKKIVAEKVFFGNVTVKLRNADGVPLWVPSIFMK